MLFATSPGLWLVLAAGAALAQGDPRNPFQDNRGAVEVGRGVFRIACSPCHGIHAEGGRGPDLTRGVYSVGDRDADLFNVISKGVPGSEMSAFEGLGEDDIWRIVSFLRSVVARGPAEKVLGEPASGEKLFWGKGACGQCHRVGTRGSVIGPDLTRAGRSRSVAYLRESVVSPSADLTPGYRTITVLTRDGRKIAGVQRSFDNFSAQLIDSRNTYHSFLRSELASVERETRSLMPHGYGTLFTSVELDDLVAFLSSLGVKQ